MTKRNLSLKERFLSHVFIPENLDVCWEWTGYTNSEGYGKFRIENKKYGIHRISFELFIGPIPDGMLVCHTCDNPSCVNPSHLFLGTAQSNMTDKVNKNRQSYTNGEANGMSKLNKEKVYRIRELIEQGHTNTEIAEMFGVSQATISSIKLGTRWDWLK